MKLCCIACNKQLKNYKVWYLSDVKEFKDRELFILKCPHCRNITVALKEVRIADNKQFVDKIQTEVEALKTIVRENKRVIKEVISSDNSSLNGWIYGVNKELRNRKGEIVQIRQYASDFKQNKNLVKKIMVKNAR